MARVRLRVVIDDPGRPRTAGEEVAGAVEVEADEDATCRRLVASVGWATNGEANAAAGPRNSTEIGAGAWPVGFRSRFPFRLAVPEGPPTYSGRKFGVLWTVRVDADLSWALDPQDEAAFPVDPPPPGEGAMVAKVEAGGCETGCAIAALLLFGAGAFTLLFAADAPEFLKVAATLAGAAVALFAVPQAIAYRRLGSVTVEAWPSPVPRGGDMACRVVLRPAKDCAPLRVTATLVAGEKSVRGSGKSRRTSNVEVSKSSADLVGPDRVAGCTEGVWAGMVPVPADAPPSLDAEPHSVSWKLKVVVGMPAWLPDPDYDLEVRVA